MEKNENSKNIVRISLYGIVRAGAYSSSTSCTYIKYFVFETMSKSLKKLNLKRDLTVKMKYFIFNLYRITFL